MKRKKSVLFSDYTTPPPSAVAKQACVQIALVAAHRVPRKTSLPAQLRAQLGYVGLWFWLGLAGLIVLLLACLWQVGQQELQPQDAMRSTMVLLAVAGPALAAMAAPVLVRSHTSGMWELEEACCHNLARLTALRLSLCALAALPVLLVAALVGFGFTGALLGILCLAFPFFLANGLCYCILGHLRGTVGIACCAGGCLLLALLFIILCGRWYEFPWLLPTLPLLAPVLLVAGGLLCWFSARRYIRHVVA